MGMYCFGIGVCRLNEGATESSNHQVGAQSSNAGSRPSVNAQHTAAAAPEGVTAFSSQAAGTDTPTTASPASGAFPSRRA